MGAQSIFLTSAIILLVFNGIMIMIPSSGATAPTIASIIATVVGMVAVLVAGSITVFGSGIDTRVYRYIFALSVIIGLCFSITIQWSDDPADVLTVGVGLISNILNPFLFTGGYFGSYWINMIGLAIGSLISFIFLISGLILVVGPSGD
jgi:hypothetical protein